MTTVKNITYYVLVFFNYRSKPSNTWIGMSCNSITYMK